MSNSWARMCNVKDFDVYESFVEVRFPGGRRHRVYVEENDTAILLTGFVVRQSVVAAVEDLPRKAWTRNRSTSLVGFRIDDRGRLVGEADVPKAGLGGSEMRHYLRKVAEECDRFEYVLTGADRE